MRFVRFVAAPVLVALTAFTAGVGVLPAFAAGVGTTPGSAAGVGATPTLASGSAEKGKALFIQHGCWQCHDFNGEGSIATSNGKVIARTALPLDAFISFVRTTDGPMPPFRPAILSDADLTDIYAYLQSLPEPKQPSDIPLLNNNTRSQ